MIHAVKLITWSLVTIIFTAVLATGCASAAKKAGKAAVHTTVEGAKVSAKTAGKAVKVVGKGAGTVAAGAAHMVTGHEDEE